MQVASANGRFLHWNGSKSWHPSTVSALLQMGLALLLILQSCCHIFSSLSNAKASVSRFLLLKLLLLYSSSYISQTSSTFSDKENILNRLAKKSIHSIPKHSIPNTWDLWKSHGWCPQRKKCIAWPLRFVVIVRGNYLQTKRRPKSPHAPK